MKKYLILFTLLTAGLTFGQEWGNVNKNTVTLKEIAPVWPGCESKSGAGIDACFKQNLAQHIGKNYKYPPEAYKNNEQGKVIVEFFINEKGLVEIKNISGGSKSLQEEAKRNILLIPKMAKPGMLGGKPTPIKYTVPITFNLGK